MTAYYNEFNRKSAAALRQLIADGLIAPGDVDERSILDVTYDDIKHYTQCHFFAGIGGWSLALRMAGWPDDRPVWTGSCPCQPFSEAGGRLGLADERHLWPFWYDLIAQRGDGVLFGEQVDAAIRYGWLDLVRDDLEAIGHAIAAVGLPAACVGAPHIRQRLWFVADTGRECGQPDGHDVGSSTGSSSRQARQQWVRADPGAIRFDGVGHPADASGQRLEQHAQCDGRPERSEQQAPRGLDVDGRSGLLLGVALGDAERTRLPQRLGLPGVPGWALGAGTRQAVVGAGIHAVASSMGDANQCGFTKRNGLYAEDGRDVAEHVADSSCASPTRVADTSEVVARRAAPQARAEERRALWRTWDSAVWIDCKDGKRRPIPGPTERGILLMADGLFYALANVNAEWVIQTAEAMIHGAADTTRPDETLRMVFERVREKTLQRTLGGPHELCETEVLLSFLQRVRAACASGFDRSCFAQEDSIDSEEKLRGLRTQIASRCTSLRRESDEQRGCQPADVVRELSQFLARCCAESAREACRSNASTFPLAANVKHRVALLHGSGNAIVPAVAAAFIQEYLATRSVIP